MKLKMHYQVWRETHADGSYETLDRMPTRVSEVIEEEDLSPGDEANDKDELADLRGLVIRPLYKDNLKGILVMRLKTIDFTSVAPKDLMQVARMASQSKRDQVQVFMVFKSSRMSLKTKSVSIDMGGSKQPMEDQMVRLRIGEKAERVTVSLFKEGSNGDELLAKGFL